MQFQPLLNERTYQKVKGRPLYFNSISDVAIVGGLIYQYIKDETKAWTIILPFVFEDCSILVCFAHILEIINLKAQFPQQLSDVMS